MKTNLTKVVVAFLWSTRTYNERNISPKREIYDCMYFVPYIKLGYNKIYSVKKVT